jgi:hypothetical protein
VSTLQCTSSRLRCVKSSSIKSNIFTVPHVEAPIFNWTYLRCDWWCIDKSMRVIHNIRFTLCQLWCQSNTILLLFLIFRLQYLIERIYDDVGEMSTIVCVLYSTFTAKCSLNPPDYAMLTLVPGKPNKITVLLMQASIFNWTYLWCDCWFITIQCALYSTSAAKVSRIPRDYAMLTLFLVKPNNVTVLLVQASIFNWTYLRCN